MNETHEKFLLSAAEAAAALGVSRTTWYALYSAGKTPLGIKLNRCHRWSAEELRDWTRAGCPARQKWEFMKGNRTMLNVNIFGDVQAGNLQIGHGASIQENVGTEKKNKGIFKKLLKIISVITSIAGWLEPIKAFIYKILLHK